MLSSRRVTTSGHRSVAPAPSTLRPGGSQYASSPPSTLHDRPSRVVVVHAARQGSNPVILGLVSALTESLRLLGVGKDRYEDVVATAPKKVTRLWPGDVWGVMREISKDFKQNKYIITGIISDKIYDPDCLFADPTIAFNGLNLWKRNLQLLTPFLIDPSTEMLSIKRLGKLGEDGEEVLKSEWRLRTYLNLPWKPLIDILGTTEYTLNDKSNVAHLQLQPLLESDNGSRRSGETQG
eukprot:gene6459-3092_t